MRVPVKLLGFVFWLFFFHCGQCQQECLRESFIREHIELPEKASYNHGETVRVSCMAGFTGMYRLRCDNRIFRVTNSRACEKRKCGHPGDIPNGDFKLTKESEFVFGATVIYTCKRGFEMTSRIYQRTCRAQGWDNTLPACEVMKCPAIETDRGVTASGNTEDGSYGDVIHFECVSSDQMINGSSEIHCTEMGEWSDSVPTCKDITCTAPDIPNADGNDRNKVYQKDEILKYNCLHGFKPREGSPKCAKSGWTLNPECEEITCVLKSTTIGVQKIDPAGKTIFRAGERVRITCTEKWFFQTKESIQSFRCKDDGQWDHQPVCVEIRCEVPYDQHVYWPTYSFSGDRKLGVKKSYSCDSGYDQVEAVATCTRDGWTPKPLCAEKMCAAPNILNAQILGEKRLKYKINSRIQYKCNTGFEPEQPVQITCDSQRIWTGIRQCSAKKNFCPDKSVENGEIFENSIEGELIYSCNTGYKTFTGNWWDSVTCREGSWSEEPRCIPVEECGAFPSVQHGILTLIQDQGTAEVKCDKGFKPTLGFIKCVNGTWETAVCEGCKIPPKVENALITHKPEELYVDGSSVTYKCRTSFSMTGESTVSCRNGIWGKTPTCEDCGALPSVQRGTLTLRDQVTAEVKCDPGLIPTTHIIKCVSGTWETAVCEDITCTAPDIPNADGIDLVKVYQKDDILEYKCLQGFKPREGSPKCTKSGWTLTPECEAVKCPVIPKKKGVTASGNTEDGSYGDVIHFECVSPGRMIDGSRNINCTEMGEWSDSVPTCKVITCTAPDIPNADRIDRVKEYRKDNILEYKCLEGFKPREGSPKCTKSGWTPKPECEDLMMPQM